ncbi:hypothetical protein HMPREF1316_0663 [Olsenella profusa F0195]|uniref:Uncharacterized protein n=1 Tax=Olsenella profusa F0195 TaxID=1125712 RepID=U2TI98_9ACTN|nr:hypothetical protein HMPREF1316_0663 [Olsenella profusa F0195]
MCGGINSNGVSADDVASTLRNSLGDYLDFSLQNLGEGGSDGSGLGDGAVAAPVSGNADHDALNGTVTDALHAWSDLIDADAGAVVDAASAFEDVDAQAAARMLGVDSG